jgi:hypothetical protein
LFLIRTRTVPEDDFNNVDTWLLVVKVGLDGTLIEGRLKPCKLRSEGIYSFNMSKPSGQFYLTK